MDIPLSSSSLDLSFDEAQSKRKIFTGAINLIDTEINRYNYEFQSRQKQKQNGDYECIILIDLEDRWNGMDYTRAGT